MSCITVMVNIDLVALIFLAQSSKLVELLQATGLMICDKLLH